MKKLLISIISFYQNFLSFDKGILTVFTPGGVCRYNPSCSEYTKQAISKYGVIVGIRMGAQRVWSCR